jgi:transcriptional regulator with XRE-family HTH domain
VDVEKDGERQPSRHEARVRLPIEVDLAPDANRIFQGLSLGERLAIARLQRGLTQKQFSELVGKSRATIIQYEQGRLQPPLQQIETMARVLDIAPELLAFGRQGITGLAAESAGVSSIPEIELDGREEVVSGGHGFAKGLVDHLGIEPANARVYVLAEAAPNFGLGKGDRIIVNDVRELTHENRLYALRTPGGVAVARLLPGLSSSSPRVNLNGGHGETASYSPGELTVLGLVVGSIQAR